MSNTTVEQFAAELKRPVDDLLKQLKEAGVNKSSGSDSLTLDDKQLLNAYLKKKTAMTAEPSVSAAKNRSQHCQWRQSRTQTRPFRNDSFTGRACR